MERINININEFLAQNPEYKEKYDAMTDEERQQLPEVVEKIVIIVNATLLIVKRAVEACGNFLSDYQNKHVVHLAIHSKKKRIRKKNMHRIRKDIKRWVNG